ncbi:MAG: phosphotransferase family protein [Dehalococcoidia bacterium]
MAVDRRYPQQPFDPALIQSFLRGRTPQSVELFESGKINTNYKLTFTDDDSYVLRLYRRDNSQRESYVMGLVRDLVPVPDMIDRGESWAVFSFLPGQLLENTPQHTGAAAEVLARLASVAFDSTGWISGDGSVSPFPFNGVRGYIAEILQNSTVRSWVGPERSEAIVEIIENESQRLDELEAQSCLVHGDFNPTNILIHEGNVSGVLDWEFCHSGTHYMDIGNLLRNTDPAYHQDIQSGLARGGLNLPVDWQERAELIDLTSHLESLSSQRADSFKGLCLARIDQFIRRFRA